MSWFRPLLALAAAAVLLAGCGFHPIYGGDKRVLSELAVIRIDPIADRFGQQLRNQLLDDINPIGQPRDPRYHLSVRVDESKEGLAVRKTELASRANLRFVATFGLTTAEAEPSEVFSGRVVIVTSYNILNSEFGTLAAERDARARAVRELSAEIASRLAAYFQLSDQSGNRAS